LPGSIAKKRPQKTYVKNVRLAFFGEADYDENVDRYLPSQASNDSRLGRLESTSVAMNTAVFVQARKTFSAALELTAVLVDFDVERRSHATRRPQTTQRLAEHEFPASTRNQLRTERVDLI
jgi:hypothetical protein